MKIEYFHSPPGGNNFRNSKNYTPARKRGHNSISRSPAALASSDERRPRKRQRVEEEQQQQQQAIAQPQVLQQVNEELIALEMEEAVVAIREEAQAYPEYYGGRLASESTTAASSTADEFDAFDDFDIDL